MDIEVEEIGPLLERVGAGEATRHDRIADVVESTELRAFYEIVFDTDDS